ncbi:7TM-DISM domain-containing protein [Lysobacter sp. cf310]|uniref:7TM-DISM domain-containing protein n=1 Tax=Lysobacter sp. cf310 TaxID=1761790 RepID=UPI0015878EF3|nr:7TM-DISM domain-containing protein [Lysobacter sp. cf310]
MELLKVERMQRERPLDAAVVARWTAAVPADVIRIEVPRRAAGHWLRLSVDRDIGADEQRSLSIEGARVFGMLRYYAPGTDRLIEISPVASGQATLLRMGWELPLPQGWKRGDPVYVQMQGRISSAFAISLSTRAELARRYESDRRFAVVTYSILLLMTLFVAALWVATRETVYLLYSAYMVCMSAYMLLLSRLIDIQWDPMIVRDGVGWAAATLATVFQLAFSLRFLDLPRWAPRISMVLRAIVWINVAWLLVLALAFRQVYFYWYIVGNALLLLAIPLLLYAAFKAWRRGAEFAGYYLLGWTPLMVFACLSALKAFGVGSAEWAERGLVLAVVLESGVLMMALTQRAAARHRRAAP